MSLPERAFRHDQRFGCIVRGELDCSVKCTVNPAKRIERTRIGHGHRTHLDQSVRDRSLSNFSRFVTHPSRFGELARSELGSAKTTTDDECGKGGQDEQDRQDNDPGILFIMSILSKKLQ